MWPPTPGTGLKACGPGDRFCLPPGVVPPPLMLFADALLLADPFLFLRLLGCLFVSDLQGESQGNHIHASKFEDILLNVAIMIGQIWQNQIF